MLRLPKELESCRDAFQKALTSPVLAEWPEAESFHTAEQAAEIAKVLIGKLHDHLGSARIAYLYRKQAKKGDRVQLAKAKKAPPLMTFLAEYDFVIVINWTAWRSLEPHQRVALVDHELSHCVMDYDKGKWATASHDVQEFSAIVRRWGLWAKDLEGFADAMAEQAELFPPASLAKTVGDLGEDLRGKDLTMTVSAGGKSATLGAGRKR